MNNMLVNPMFYNIFILHSFFNNIDTKLKKERKITNAICVHTTSPTGSHSKKIHVLNLYVNIVTISNNKQYIVLKQYTNS